MSHNKIRYSSEAKGILCKLKFNLLKYTKQSKSTILKRKNNKDEETTYSFNTSKNFRA